MIKFWITKSIAELIVGVVIVGIIFVAFLIYAIVLYWRENH